MDQYWPKGYPDHGSMLASDIRPILAWVENTVGKFSSYNLRGSSLPFSPNQVTIGFVKRNREMDISLVALLFHEI